MAEIPTFQERARAESTRDPIFLFQSRRYIMTGMPLADEGEYGHDGEGVCLGDNVDGLWRPRQEAEYLSGIELSKLETSEGVPAAIETWDTQFVTLSREEGEQHGRERAYRYPDGWRVYCVPCDGLLAAMIKTREAEGV